MDRAGHAADPRSWWENARPAVIGLGAVVVAQALLAAPRASAAEHGARSRSVSASLETDSVPSSFDAADDAAIWVHPADSSLSILIGTDKRSGFVVYDLQGRMLHNLRVGRMNNVDLRYGFPLGGQEVDIVVASDRSRNALAVFQVTPHDRSLREIAESPIPVGVEAYGACMYQSPLTRRFFAFVVGRKGGIEQWELSSNGSSGIRGTLVRELPLGTRGEGCVADDQLGHLYVGEEKIGIWKFAAEPTAPVAGTLIDSTQRPGRLTSDVEGLTLYYAADGAGYLLASSQGSNEFMVYERAGENRFVLSFRISAGVVDGVTETDGIDVVGFNLGPGFPNGAFVAQDDRNSADGYGKSRRAGRNQNFKLVPWEGIARLGPERPLVIDNTIDPRGLCISDTTPCAPLRPVP